MRRRGLISALVLAAALFVAGCAIEPPLHLKQAMMVIVKVIWKVEVYPEGVKPSGITMYFFRDGEFYRKQSTSEVDSCAVYLEPGHYQMYMISQSPYEFAYMDFLNMDDYDNASVRVRETKSRWYTRADGEVLINNPEEMVVGVSEEFDITEEMLSEYPIYNSSNKAEWKGSRTIRIPVYPRSIVSQYWITAYSENADALKAVRASTTGFARDFLLTKDISGSEGGTQLITSWSLTIDDPISRTGHIDGIITTFGFPDGDTPSPDRDPSLNVSTLLIDDTTVQDYVFKVGNLISGEAPSPGYRMLYRLILGSVDNPVLHPPDIHPPDDVSGFDATVSDWEDGEIIDISM